MSDRQAEVQRMSEACQSE